MHGIMIKRLGHHVRVLEQSPLSDRAGQAAGISAGPQVQEFFTSHDRSQQPYSIDCPGVQFVDRGSRVKWFWKKPMQMTNWSTLYYRLRANFDGLASEYCPEPPTASEKEGKVEYLTMKRVTDVQETDGSKMIVKYDDLATGANESLRADLIIAADGSNSTCRRMLLPNVQRPYAGYVAWRGTVAEQDVSPESNRLFDSRVTVHRMGRNYILV